MNNEKSVSQHGVRGLAQTTEDRSTPKHEITDNSIENLGSILNKLEYLSSKISNEPSTPKNETTEPLHSLEGHLITASERINSFINAAGVMIEQIEEKLF